MNELRECIKRERERFENGSPSNLQSIKDIQTLISFAERALGSRMPAKEGTPKEISRMDKIISLTEFEKLMKQFEETRKEIVKARIQMEILSEQILLFYSGGGEYGY